MSAFHDLATFQNAPQTLSATGYYLNQFFIYIKLAVSLFGAITVLFGAVIAIYRYVIYRFTHLIGIVNLNGIRLDLARTIILGLEFFIAGDVIETTITPDFQALGILAVLVVIRTLLNYSLHKEIKALSTIPGSGVNAND